MGMVDGEFIVNPSQKEWDKGDLQLTVASTAEKVIMICLLYTSTAVR